MNEMGRGSAIALMKGGRPRSEAESGNKKLTRLCISGSDK
jgi:hypothetical protein